MGYWKQRLIFFFVARQPMWTDWWGFMNTSKHSVKHPGWVIDPMHRPLPDNTQSQQTDIRIPCGIRTRIPNKPAPTNPERGNRDRRGDISEQKLHVSLFFRIQKRSADGWSWKCFLPIGEEHLVFSLLSKYTYIKITIYRIIIWSLGLYVCKTWSLTLRDKHTVRMSEKNRGLSKIFEPKRKR
jgi:hypothetical protein